MTRLERAFIRPILENDYPLFIFLKHFNVERVLGYDRGCRKLQCCHFVLKLTKVLKIK